MVAGQSYTFSLVGGTLTDAYLELRDSSGTVIGIDDDFGPQFNSTIRWTATTTGTYYVNARAFEDTTPTLTGSYTLSAAASAPASPLDSIDYHYTMPTTNIAIWFSTPGYTNPSGDATLRAWTQPEIDAVIAALGTYSAIAPLTFSVASTQGAATWIFTLTDLPGNTLGYFAVGSQFAAFDPTVSSFTAGLVPGGNSWATIIHEAGHGLGMAHPHDNGAENYGVDNSEIMQGVTGPFGAYGTFLLNQGVFTTMSYNDGWETSGFGGTGSLTAGDQSTPMALDVALIQQRYGTNPNTGAGASTYTLALASSSYICIWDVSGTDLISYSGSASATIDLRAATLLNAIGGGGYVSFVQGVHGGYTIANGVVIENATSGTGDDTLNGNEANNTLTANFGTDTLNGNGGNDTLNGGAGNDLINGGAGVDTSVYTVASTSGSWVRDPSGVWTVNGNGSDTLSSVEVLNFTDRNVVLDNAFRTFTGDGTSDLLWRNANTGAVAVWQMSGAVQTNAYIAGGAPADWAILGTGDFNGDGRDDIIWRNTNTTAVAVWADGSGTAASIITGVPNNWQFQGVGDFNFDGRDDFVWRNDNDGAVAVWLMNGNTISSQSIVSAAPAAWTIAGIADFDGDGRDDFLLRNTDGTIARWTTDGVTQTGAAIVGSAPASWQIQGVGDFNGDGRADILFRNTSDGGLAMWQMNGNTTLGVQMVGGAPLSWSISNVGDYNGDGRDDILWHNTDGTVALWTMNGFAVQNQAIVGNVPVEWGLI